MFLISNASSIGSALGDTPQKNPIAVILAVNKEHFPFSFHNFKFLKR